jgi:hypothetical protein
MAEACGSADSTSRRCNPTDGSGASPRPRGWSIQSSYSLLQGDRVDLSSPTTRDIVCSEAQRSRPEAAGRRAFGGTRRCGTFYPALSAVTYRPLHIVSGDVGRVTQTVVDLTTRGAEPIVLLRSAFEYGCDHYELAEEL